MAGSFWLGLLLYRMAAEAVLLEKRSHKLIRPCYPICHPERRAARNERPQGSLPDWYRRGSHAIWKRIAEIDNLHNPTGFRFSKKQKIIFRLLPDHMKIKRPTLVVPVTAGQVLYEAFFSGRDQSGKPCGGPVENSLLIMGNPLLQRLSATGKKGEYAEKYRVIRIIFGKFDHYSLFI
jgi:hypothetical protein